MPRNPFPSFYFYADDWLASKARALMTLEEQGAYLNLLCHAWTADPPCTLPNDPDQLAALSGLGDKWQAAAPRLLRWFIERRGRLVNVKLYGIYQQAKTQRALKVAAGIEGGRRSAELRANEAKQRLSIGQAESKPPIPIPKKEKELGGGKKPPRETPRDSLAEEFETKIRPAYPKRDGDQRWIQASSSYRVARRSGETFEAIRDGLARYVRWCDHKQIVGTSSVKQAGTFFGREKCWREPWEVRANGIQHHAVRKLRLASGREIEVPNGKRVEFTDNPEACDVYELPNGILSVREGARWVRQ